jgi:hypothetical protein
MNAETWVLSTKALDELDQVRDSSAMTYSPGHRRGHEGRDPESQGDCAGPDRDLRM